jgi:hypothetical protein
MTGSCGTERCTGGSDHPLLNSVVSSFGACALIQNGFLASDLGSAHEIETKIAVLVDTCFDKAILTQHTV